MTDPGRTPEVDKTRPLSDERREAFLEADRSPAGSVRGRFEVLELLGTGGMGEVYKAYDPLLTRFVALKLLKGHATAPLLREARAQARVDDERVCKVYEVGELPTGPYIAMRYVAGPPLDVAAAGLPLEAQVRLFREVAEGLHAAHREGLVHRDVKPGNVLVETTADGTLRPCIVDFGLALEPGAPGSVTRSAVGTPAYMAPEQARGDTARIDRRTDVYSLGVTMWEVLAGVPMVKGASVVEILLKVVHEEPVPIRTRRPDLPRDLATVVMACVRKEPERRYPSARALADDLGRYLAGESVEARPTGAFERLARQARKHRAVAGAVAVAVLSAVLFGGAALRTSIESGRRQDAAQHLGRAVERMEWTLRQAYLLPLHDVRPARREVEEEMRRVAETMARRGPLAEGAGRYALGRGHLVLGRPEEAQRELEAARAAGYGSPDVSYALGRALVERYRRERERSGLIPDPKAREARRKALARELKEPALVALRASRVADGAALNEGFVAFLEERPAEAREKARVAFRREPALYEALWLEGDVEALRGRTEQEGGRYDEALAAYDAAGVAYRAALDVGRSDPRLHLEECSRLLKQLEVELRRGRDGTRYYEDGRAACRAALVADAGLVRAEALLSRYEWQMADALGAKGSDPTAALARAIEAGERAVASDRQEAEGWANLGISFWSQAEALARGGADPGPSFRKAADALAVAERLSPTGPHQMDRGSVLLESGNAELERGGDPRPFLDAAAAAYAAAVKLMPHDSRLHSNMGNVATVRASYEERSGRNPIPAIEEAIRHYGKAIELNPRSPVALYNLGEALLGRARAEAKAGRDPAPFVALAIESDERALAVNPRLALAHSAIAEGHLVLAAELVRAGRDPAAALGAARQAAREALAVNPALASAKARLETADQLGRRR